MQHERTGMQRCSDGATESSSSDNETASERVEQQALALAPRSQALVQQRPVAEPRAYLPASAPEPSGGPRRAVPPSFKDSYHRFQIAARLVVLVVRWSGSRLAHPVSSLKIRRPAELQKRTGNPKPLSGPWTSDRNSSLKPASDSEGHGRGAVPQSHTATQPHSHSRRRRPGRRAALIGSGGSWSRCCAGASSPRCRLSRTPPPPARLLAAPHARPCSVMPKSKRNKIGAFAVCYSPSTTTSQSHCVAAWLLGCLAACIDRHSVAHTDQEAPEGTQRGARDQRARRRQPVSEHLCLQGRQYAQRLPAGSAPALARQQVRATSATAHDAGTMTQAHSTATTITAGSSWARTRS